MGKIIIQKILQTKSQLERALENIFYNADLDNVRCKFALNSLICVDMELAVRPDTYSRDSLTSEEALQIILNHVARLNQQYKNKVMVGVVVYVSSTSDDPVSFYTQAQLAVKYHDQGRRIL